MVWALVAKVRRRFEVRIEGFGMATVLVTEGVVRIDCSPRREPGQSALYPFDSCIRNTTSHNMPFCHHDCAHKFLYLTAQASDARSAHRVRIERRHVRSAEGRSYKGLVNLANIFPSRVAMA